MRLSDRLSSFTGFVRKRWLYLERVEFTERPQPRERAKDPWIPRRKQPKPGGWQPVRDAGDIAAVWQRWKG
jgi:hypothetical protein